MAENSQMPKESRGTNPAADRQGKRRWPDFNF